MVVDYSKFDSVVDSDDEKEEATDNQKEQKPPHCANCHEMPKKPVRCGSCKSTVYCNADCQKSDWKFHKRICKPEKKPTTPDKRAASPPPSTRASSSTSPAKKPVTDKPKKKISEEKDDDEDEKFEWYRHRETKLPSCPNSVPKKLGEGEVPVAATQNIPEQGGSAWNAAGTWEDKDVSKWAIADIKRRCKVEASSCTFGPIRTESVKCTGDASITVIRGVKRYLFDFNVIISWEARFGDNSQDSGYTTISGDLVCEEFSHQSDISSLELVVRNLVPGTTDAKRQHVIKAVSEAVKTELAGKVRENLASFVADMADLDKK